MTDARERYRRQTLINAYDSVNFVIESISRISPVTHGVEMRERLATVRGELRRQLDLIDGGVLR